MTSSAIAPPSTLINLPLELPQTITTITGIGFTRHGMTFLKYQTRAGKACSFIKKSTTAFLTNLLGAVEKIVGWTDTRPPYIDKTDAPVGVLLVRSSDWLSVEYEVHVTKLERRNDYVIKRKVCIGRLVEQQGQIVAYRNKSAIATPFNSTKDAIAFLVQTTGHKLDLIEAASIFQPGEF